MHPSSAALMAFCDVEAGSAGGRRIAKHLLKCEKCRGEVLRIEGEKDQLSIAQPTGTVEELQPGLAALTSSMSAWRNGRTVILASQVKNRVRSQIEVYLGSPAISLVEHPGMGPEELFARSGEILDALLGPSAAAAVRDEVLSGLDCARTVAETQR